MRFYEVPLLSRVEILFVGSELSGTNSQIWE